MFHDEPEIISYDVYDSFNFQKSLAINVNEIDNLSLDMIRSPHMKDFRKIHSKDMSQNMADLFYKIFECYGVSAVHSGSFLVENKKFFFILLVLSFLYHLFAGSF